MNPLSIAQLIQLGLQLAYVGVLAVERIHGEKLAGTAKKEIAKTEIVNAANVALGAGLSEANTQLAQSVATSAINSIDLAVLIGKAKGDYQAATAAAKAALPTTTAAS